MKYCSKCGKELIDEAVICPGCGCVVNQSLNAVQPEDDEVSVGLCIVSALFPLFGFIYWAIQYKKTPKKAKACGVTAIVAWVVSFCIGFIIGFTGALV